MVSSLKWLISLMIGGIAYLLGGWDMGLQVLISLVMLDYVTGVMEAICSKKIDPWIGFIGIVKKIGLLIAVMVAVQVERLMNQTDTIHPLVCYALAVNEGFSVLKNLRQMGVPIPDIFFYKMKDLQADNRMATREEENTAILKEENKGG